MNLLEQLEGKINELLETLAGLRKENARLRQEIAAGSNAHEEEMRRLREELQQERDAKEAVLSRIDALLDKLKAESESEES